MDDDVPDSVQDIVSQRVSFERQILQLGELAERFLSHERATDGEIARVDNILREVDRELRELIECKKSSGVFAQLLEVSPELKHTVDALLRDHERLLVELAQVLKALPQADHCADARKRLHGWIERFREFDHREIALLQNVWNVDFGAAD